MALAKDQKSPWMEKDGEWPMTILTRHLSTEHTPNGGETEEPTYSNMFSLFRPAIIVSYLHTLVILWKVAVHCMISVQCLF